MKGYGVYGLPTNLSFSADMLSMFTRGWIIAYPHIRGSGDSGYEWHESAKQLNKINSVNDYLACIRYLHDNGFSTPARTGATGASAGATILACAALREPELFHAIALHFPFLDVLSALLDDSHALTVFDRNEWGNPHDAKSRAFIQSICPYHITLSLLSSNPVVPVPARLPHMCVVAGVDDPRIQTWQPAKFVAAQRLLRERRKVSGDLLFRMLDVKGHFGVGGRYGKLDESTFEIGFFNHYIK
eukprot:c1393_g1_i2.p1 GENE.c1393_g1_i2~~c1393_g1_i2.p1  ORF type:complete len:244 (+),score=48.42 c1393_g1_i2:735-1466(+)